MALGLQGKVWGRIGAAIDLGAAIQGYGVALGAAREGLGEDLGLQ